MKALDDADSPTSLKLAVAPAPHQALRVVHRTLTPEGFLLGGGALTEHQFVVSTELPRSHPLFNDTQSTLHDIQIAVDAMRKAVVFLGREYYRVPSDRPLLVESAEITATDIAAWRDAPGPTYAEIAISLRPLDVAAGVPLSLACSGTISVNDALCGDLSGRLVFLPPRVDARPEGSACLDGVSPSTSQGTLDVTPELVGRTDERNVTICGPLDVSDDSVIVQIPPAAPGSVFRPAHAHHAPGMLLVEAGRQAALLAAGRLRGFSPGFCTLTHWSGGFLELIRPPSERSPLRCLASPGTVSRDAEGRPRVDVDLKYVQSGNQVGHATLSVLQDC